MVRVPDLDALSMGQGKGSGGLPGFEGMLFCQLPPHKADGKKVGRYESTPQMIIASGFSTRVGNLK